MAGQDLFDQGRPGAREPDDEDRVGGGRAERGPRGEEVLAVIGLGLVDPAREVEPGVVLGFVALFVLGFGIKGFFVKPLNDIDKQTALIREKINKINNERQEHIITIEDPIEYLHPHKKCLVNQREVGQHTKSFKNALSGGLTFESVDLLSVYLVGTNLSQPNIDTATSLNVFEISSAISVTASSRITIAACSTERPSGLATLVSTTFLA